MDKKERKKKKTAILDTPEPEYDIFDLGEDFSEKEEKKVKKDKKEKKKKAPAEERKAPPKPREPLKPFVPHTPVETVKADVYVKDESLYEEQSVDIDELLKILGLYEHRNKLPNQLSGGQQQRVSIGRALFSSPQVILADEPTGNLDSKNSAEIIELLRRSNRELKQTTLLITHDEHIAEQCDRIIVLSDGKIISDEGNTVTEEANSNEI